MKTADILQVADLVIKLGVMPLCWVLWDLSKTLTELKVALYRDFVSKADLRTIQGCK